MAEVEWIKLNVRLFDNKKIKEIRRVYKDAGNDIVLIWIMFLALAGQCNNDGFVTLSSRKNYSLESLSDELRYDEETIQLALEVLSEHGMVTTDDEFGICINNWEKYQNTMSLERIREQGRVRQARYRERQKANNVTSEHESRYVTQENKKEEKEREKEKTYIVENKKKEPEHCQSCQFVNVCDKSINEHFEYVWKYYPEKSGKSGVKDSTKKELYKYSYSQLETAINKYEDYVKSRSNDRFKMPYKNGDTFFRTYYKDYLEESQNDEKTINNEVYRDSAGNVHGRTRQG